MNAGQSIQAAIDRCGPGDPIIVEAGTYAEQLTITRKATQLVGVDAVLIPPATPAANTCSGLAGPGTEAGVCITGSEIVFADFVVEHRKVVSVGKRVSGVSVSGFSVSGFSGINIAVVGGDGVQVKGNKLNSGPQYGSLNVGSINSLIDANDIAFPSSLGFIAICADDYSGVQVSNNHISEYAIGLCVQTNGAHVYHNSVTNSCIGSFVDPGIIAAEVSRNHISNGNPICATIPDLGVSGVVMSGAINTLVKKNLIEGLRPPN